MTIWPFGRRRKPMVRIAELEAVGEAAYGRMYDARRPRDFWDDARAAFTDAIRIAAANRLYTEAARLQARLDHIRAVYNSQFR